MSTDRKFTFSFALLTSPEICVCGFSFERLNRPCSQRLDYCQYHRFSGFIADLLSADIEREKALDDLIGLITEKIVCTNALYEVGLSIQKATHLK